MLLLALDGLPRLISYALMLAEYGRLAEPRLLKAKTLKDQDLVELCRRRKQLGDSSREKPPTPCSPGLRDLHF